MAKKMSRLRTARARAWLNENREGFAAYNKRAEHGSFIQSTTRPSIRSAGTLNRNFGTPRDWCRFRILRIKDHGDGGSYSWIVFDIETANRAGEYTYVADCINAKSARLVADALNAFISKKR